MYAYDESLYQVYSLSRLPLWHIVFNLGFNLVATLTT